MRHSPDPTVATDEVKKRVKTASWITKVLMPLNATPGSVIFGIVTVTTVAAIEQGVKIRPIQNYYILLLAWMDLWIVSSVFTVISDEFKSERRISNAERFVSARSQIGVLTGGLVPAVVMLVVALLGGTSDQMDVAGVIAGTAMLTIVMMTSAIRAGYHALGITLSACASVVLCGIVILERAILR